MIVAKIRCTKSPVICTNQTGRSYLYCNGAIECDSQRGVLEWDTAQQNTKEAEKPAINKQSEPLLCPLRKCKNFKRLCDVCVRTNPLNVDFMQL